MGIKQTLAAIGLSLVAAFSSGAQAQQPPAKSAKHCMDGMLDMPALAKKLFATPVDKWNDAYLSSIGPANIVDLLVKQLKSFEKGLSAQVDNVGRAIHSNKKAVDWAGLKNKTHFLFHETLEKAEKEQWDINKWTSEAKIVSGAYVYTTLAQKINSIRQVDNPAACPTTP